MKHGAIFIVVILALVGYIVWAVHEVLTGPMKNIFA